MAKVGMGTGTLGLSAPAQDPSVGVSPIRALCLCGREIPLRLVESWFSVFQKREISRLGKASREEVSWGCELILGVQARGPSSS